MDTSIHYHWRWRQEFESQASPFPLCLNRAHDCMKQLEVVEARLSGMQLLMQERDTLRHTIHGVEALLQLRPSSPGTASQTPIPPSGQNSTIASATGVGQPIWKGARLVLSQAKGRPMTVPEIKKMLQAMQWPIARDASTEVVRTSLIRKPEIFERVGRGLFKLRKAQEEMA